MKKILTTAIILSVFVLSAGLVSAQSIGTGYPSAKKYELALEQNADSVYEIRSNQVIFKFNDRCTATILADNKGILTGREAVCLKGMKRIVDQSGKTFVEFNLFNEKIKAEITNIIFGDVKYLLLKPVDFTYNVPKNKEFKISSIDKNKIKTQYEEIEAVGIQKKMDITYYYANDYGYEKDEEEAHLWRAAFDSSNLWISDMKKKYGIVREGSILVHENNIVGIFDHVNPHEKKYWNSRNHWETMLYFSH